MLQAKYAEGPKLEDNTGDYSEIITGYDRNGNDRRFLHEYSLKDHLGSSRVTFLANDTAKYAEVVQTTDYYPFGLVMDQTNCGTNPEFQKNKYLYNNKEIQSDNMTGEAVNWYDYGARFYDPQIGRFTTIDPLAEKFPAMTTFQYASNNPVVCIDLDGLEGYKTTTKEIQTGTTNVKFTIDFKVVNASSVPNADVKHWAELGKTQIQRSLSKFDETNNKNYSASVNLNFGEGKQGDKFVLKFVDHVSFIDEKGRSQTANGYTSEINNPDVNEFQILIPGKAAENWAEKVTETSVTRTVAHETFHGFGLRHNKANDSQNPLEIGPNNIMYYYGDKTEITMDQIRIIENNLPEKDLEKRH